MVTIIKADGTKEQFSDDKVLGSIRRARIPHQLEYEVLEHVKSKLYEGISSAEIYQHILEFLDRGPHPYARSQYSLKESIMQLGPTGYPFEDFVAKLLEASGYNVRVRQILAGKCVSHEIDIMAEKNGRQAIVEAKFHNSAGNRSEVQVALYTQARFQDVQMRNQVDEVWLVTNTKTTVDANTYAQCMGMKIISWSYPDGDSLRDLIERSRLHPVTMLTSLSQGSKRILLENHIVLCKEIFQNNAVLDYLPLTKEERERTIAEVATICSQEKVNSS